MSRDKERDLVSSQAGLAAAVSVESGGHLGEGTEPVKARSYWEQVWIRFRRDKVAMASGAFIIFLVLVAIFGGPIAQHFLGHGPNEIFFSGVDDDLKPVGPMTRIADPNTGGTTLFILGSDGSLGRDEFLRLLYGARVSLEVAVLSTIGVMFVGVLMGTIAGYFRGWIDTIISRIIEVTMAFPALLFIIALAATVGDRLSNITIGGLFGKGVITLVLVFTIFGWFYPARIVRSTVLSLREKEFVEAARMVGSSDWRIMKSHILPHLVAPIVVVSTLIVASYVLAEAGLSFLGLGVKLPTASWGVLLAAAPEYYTLQPWLMIWPGLAVLMTTLAFNLLGDGLRDAFDPRATH
jgi:ABC-type dipeptide/oligopeptide/nickel transport system permease subunit